MSEPISDPVLDHAALRARSLRTRKLSSYKAGRAMRAKVAGKKIEQAIKARRLSSSSSTH